MFGPEVTVRGAAYINALLFVALLVALAIIIWLLLVDSDDNGQPAPAPSPDKAQVLDKTARPLDAWDSIPVRPRVPSEISTGDAEQRARFVAAEAALKTGGGEGLAMLAEDLRDYPLYPYLDYAALRMGLDVADTAAVSGFLERYRDTPLAPRLRDTWLDLLAAKGRWADYVRFQVPASTAAWRCRSLRALIEVGREQEAFAAATPLWLTGRSQAAECNPVFTAWRQDGGLTPELIWERIGLAMDGNNPSMVAYLRGLLPEGERHRVTDWLAVHKDPQWINDHAGGLDGHPRRALVLTHGITRLARTDAATAADSWERIQRQQSLPPALIERTSYRLGLRLLSSDPPRGLRLLGTILAATDNLDLQDRRLRAALEQQAWEAVAAWVAVMPDGEHKRDHWLYWQARAEAALGNDALAAGLYRRAANSLSLWGLLAADHIGIPYALQQVRTPADPECIRRIEDSPALARIRELRALGRTVDMRREWRKLTADMERSDLLASAVIARDLDWHDQAIFTLARADHWGDLELRFPLVHLELIRQQAAETHLDPAWIIAIARQESVFVRDVVSHAGAIGLMQLMPATARETAARIGLPTPSRRDLMDPQTNIRLGAAYLARMAERFDGHPALGSAAYNAGPHRVKRWLPKAPLAADLWIATIPFNETRAYVRRVLAYRTIYSALLGQPPQRITETLPDVVAPEPSGTI